MVKLLAAHGLPLISCQFSRGFPWVHSHPNPLDMCALLQGCVISQGDVRAQAQALAGQPASVPLADIQGTLEEERAAVATFLHTSIDQVPHSAQLKPFS